MTQADGTTREVFLMRGLLAAGAVAAGPLAGRALAQSGGGDLAVVRFALLLEQLEVAMFSHGLTLALTPGLKGAAQDLMNDDVVHVTTLEKTIGKLGGTPATAPAFQFAARGEKGFLATAVAIEDLVVSAYNGMAALLKGKGVLRTIGAIAGTEGRHAATIRIGSGLPPTQAAFDPAKTQAEVRSTVSLWLGQ